MPGTVADLLPLATERLILRLHRPDDAGWLRRVFMRPDVDRYLLRTWTEEDAAARAAERLARTDLDGETGALSLVVEHDGAPVGDLVLWLTDAEHRVAEIGWVIDPEHSGRGFARESVAALLDLAFEHCRLHRVAAQMDARNTRSARLAESVGMRQEAFLRQDCWNKGEWTDTLIFGMLESDRASVSGASRRA
ncbi:GNAT family protein [Salinibacterium sp. ZJ77]|uniref:GNAT family N-acetyltransferase n=1 Tax=Salinibacterium sp. ZJ77 TaxID=2708337 RepID=UPI0014215CAD|nr:GNAT family protein [Salinibacterium sp. ZJ77]